MFESGQYNGQDGTIWNNPQSANYKVQSASETAMNDNWFTRLLDPTGLVSGFWNDITGVTSQSREFAQQEYLQDKMNDYNDPKNQMARLKNAGINPLTAAAGIAGGGNESAQAPQVSSNTSGAAQGVSALGSAVGGFGGALASLANSRKLNEEASQVVPLSLAQIERWSHENGLSDATKRAFEIDNETRSDMNRADLNIKIQNHENMKKEGDYIQAQRDYMDRQIAWYDQQIASTIDLNEKRALEAEKNTFFIEERIKTEKMENDFAEKNGYRRDQPFDSAMLSMWFEGEYDKVLAAEQFMFQLKYGESFNVSKGEYNADPFQEEYRRAYDYRNELIDRLGECKDIIKEANKKLKSGQISKEEYGRIFAEFTNQIKSLHDQIDEADDNWHDDDYVTGHTKYWQDLLNQFLPFGLGAIAGAAGRIGKGPRKIRGYGR